MNDLINISKRNQFIRKNIVNIVNMKFIQLLMCFKSSRGEDLGEAMSWWRISYLFVIKHLISKETVLSLELQLSRYLINSRMEI